MENDGCRTEDLTVYVDYNEVKSEWSSHLEHSDNLTPPTIPPVSHSHTRFQKNGFQLEFSPDEIKTFKILITIFVAWGSKNTW